MSPTTTFIKLFNGRQIFFAAPEDKKLKGKYKNPKNIPKPRHYSNGFDDCKDELQNLNNSGWAVFFTVNEMVGGRRVKDEVKRCRAIWIDDDEARDDPRDQFPIPPNLIVNSSPGKYHYYWLTDTTEIDQWNAVMATMVEKYGCDNSAKDSCRVMRLPGYKHLKDKPFEVVFDLISDKPYKWSVIKENFPPLQHKTKRGKIKAGTEKTNTDHINAIITGENFHSSLQSVVANHANYTQSKQSLLQIARGLCAEALVSGRLPEARKDRIYSMLSEDSIELEEMVNWAFENTEAERAMDIPKAEKPGDIKAYELVYPPGLMGRLCEQIYEMAPHPNKEVAIMGGFALVAGIVGRKFNILNMGLNLYIALLADSGIGKANIKDVINKVLVSDPKNMMGSTYKGHSRFTGPRPIFEMLINGLSRVCILEEAGLMNLSTAGDQVGINRALLDIYTSSGKFQYAGGEAYSDAKSSIPLIHSPALTIAHVSTPKSFLKALKAKDSTTSGEMARLWTLRSMNDKRYLNRNKRTDFDDDIIKRLTDLMTLCSDRQREENGQTGKVHDIEIKDEIFNDADKYTDMENDARHTGDELRRTILSRAFAKSLKIAAIISVFNGSEDELSDESYDWAKNEALAKEIRYIEDSYTRESSDDMTVLARIVGISVLKCLHGEYKKSSCNADPRIAKYGIFGKSNIHQILYNNHTVREIDDPTDRQNPQKGVDKIIDYMVRRGLLHTISYERMKSYGLRIKCGYQITDDFKAFMDNE